MGCVVSWVATRDWGAGDTVTATQMDEISSSLDETAPAKITTIGDTIYGTAANALARLAIGAAGAIKHVVAGIPAWLALGTKFKMLAVNAGATALEYVTLAGLMDVSSVYVGTAQTFANTGWKDPATPGPAVTITAGAGGVNLVLFRCEMLASQLSNIGVGVGIGGADPGSNDDTVFRYEPAATVGYKPLGGHVLYTGLTPGTAYVYEMMYQGDAGTPGTRRRTITGMAF